MAHLQQRYSRQYPGSACDQAPVLTVGALNKIFTSIDEVDIWEMPASPRGPLDGEVTVEREDAHSVMPSHRLSVHRSMDNQGKGLIVRSSKQFSSPNNRSSMEMAANMSDYTQIQPNMLFVNGQSQYGRVPSEAKVHDSMASLNNRQSTVQLRDSSYQKLPVPRISELRHELEKEDTDENLARSPGFLAGNQLASKLEL